MFEESYLKVTLNDIKKKLEIIRDDELVNSEISRLALVRMIILCSNSGIKNLFHQLTFRTMALRNESFEIIHFKCNVVDRARRFIYVFDTDCQKTDEEIKRKKDELNRLIKAIEENPPIFR